MTKLTKAQLVDALIAANAAYEVLSTKYESLKAERQAPVPAANAVHSSFRDRCAAARAQAIASGRCVTVTRH